MFPAIPWWTPVMFPAIPWWTPVMIPAIPWWTHVMIMLMSLVRRFLMPVFFCHVNVKSMFVFKTIPFANFTHHSAELILLIKKIESKTALSLKSFAIDPETSRLVWPQKTALIFGIGERFFYRQCQHHLPCCSDGKKISLLVSKSLIFQPQTANDDVTF